MKTVRPTLLPDGGAVHYLWPIANDGQGFQKYGEVLTAATRSITHLGWGIDMVAANASIISQEEGTNLIGQRWQPLHDAEATRYRIPLAGSFDALTNQHKVTLEKFVADS